VDELIMEPCCALKEREEKSFFHEKHFFSGANYSKAKI
jgi:hypothetical protein